MSYLLTNSAGRPVAVIESCSSFKNYTLYCTDRIGISATIWWSAAGGFASMGMTDNRLCDEEAMKWLWSATDRSYFQAGEILEYVLNNDFSYGC